MANDYDWSAAQCKSSARKLQGMALEVVSGQIAWYQKSSGSKRTLAKALRLGAILALAFAGLQPITAQICMNDASCWPLFRQPVWASVIAASGALFLSIDRFFGYSTGWMRYISTEMALTTLRDQYAFELEARQLELEAAGSGALPKDDLLKIINAAGAFVGAAGKLVQEETGKWMAEFQDALKQVDESAKAVQAATRTGGINVTIENGDQADSGWQLVTPDGNRRQYQGKTASISGLAPGMHQVRVEAKVGGKPAAAESLVNVSAAQIAELRLALA